MTETDATKHTRSVLLLGAASELEALRRLLPAECSVASAATPQAAADLLAERHFDAVLSATPSLAALSAARPSANAETILEMIGQGVCTVDTAGALLWSNPKFQSYPDHARDVIRATASEMCGELIRARAAGEQPHHYHRSVTSGGEYHYDVTASPIFAADGQVSHAVALIWDATGARRLQDKLDAIDAAGRELVGLDTEALAEMDVNERLGVLEEKIIRYSRELLHFQHFTVRLLDKKTQRLEVLLAEGMSLATKSRQIYATTEGNGITGYVAATGRSYICPDVPRDSRYLPGINNARSSLTVALRLHDQVIGVLNVESDDVAAFGEDDRQFAEIFGRYVAIALNTLQLLAVERRATTGQITSDLQSEIAEPLNEIIAQASAIMEDYIGYDDLRGRLHKIIDTVDAVKQRVRGVREGSPQMRAIVQPGNEADPLLENRRVLIADDEDVIRETIAAVLSKAGALTVTAEDGEEAIAMIRAQHFDLVLSDINMPKRNGYEVFAAAKESDPTCSVLLITGFGYDPDHSIVRATREGLAGVIFKPFKVELLLEEVRKALGGQS